MGKKVEEITQLQQRDKQLRTKIIIFKIRRPFGYLRLKRTLKIKTERAEGRRLVKK